jgi:hypothetical protein
MALALSGTSNGSLNNLALSANTGTIMDTARAGGIIQVVHQKYTTTNTISTTTLTDTGVTADITPTSTSNKILIQASIPVQGFRSSNEAGGGFVCLRDSTTIYEEVSATGNVRFGQYFAAIGTTTTNWYSTIPFTILDSPASTSTLTYKFQASAHNTANGGFIKINASSSASGGESHLILMEVVA